MTETPKASSTSESSVEQPNPMATIAPSAASVWIGAMRPKTLAASFGPVIVGSALAGAVDQFNLPVAMACLFGALSIQIGTNFFNDYEDFKRGADTDERIGPARATQKGWVTPRAMLVATILAFVAALGFGSYLVWVGGWPIVALGLVSIVCGFAYTGGPFPLAYTGIADLFVMLFFGNAAVCGTFYLQTNTLTWPCFVVSLAIGALATAILVVNNLRDRETDTKVDKKTLVVRFGETFGRYEYAVMVFAPYLLLAGLWVSGQANMWWMLPWLSLPLAVSEFMAICVKQRHDLNPHLGSTARLGAVFSLLLVVGILV